MHNVVSQNWQLCPVTISIALTACGKQKLKATVFVLQLKKKKIIHHYLAKKKKK